jgi:hypothetical protein
VAKTHVSPGEITRAPGAKPKFWVTLPGGRVDLEDAKQRIDNPKIILDSGGFLKSDRDPTAEISIVFA